MPPGRLPDFTALYAPGIPLALQFENHFDLDTWDGPRLILSTGPIAWRVG